MSDRESLFEGFVARFHSGKRRPKAWTATQIESIESALGVSLPRSYREFVTRHGAVWTPDLLDSSLAHTAGYVSVQDFLKPAQVVAETRNWRKLDLPDDCVAFAGDASGDLFVFRGLPAQSPGPDDAAVWFFDHEEGTTRPEAASFDEWISRFLSL